MYNTDIEQFNGDQHSNYSKCHSHFQGISLLKNTAMHTRIVPLTMQTKSIPNKMF